MAGDDRDLRHSLVWLSDQLLHDRRKDMRIMRCSLRPIAPDTPNYAQNAQRYVGPSYIMLGVRGASER
jgi:hypothetical protein